METTRTGLTTELAAGAYAQRVAAHCGHVHAFRCPVYCACWCRVCLATRGERHDLDDAAKSTPRG